MIIDSVERLSSALIVLLKERRLENSKEFEFHVSPIFDLMKSVHEDYTSAFQEISEKIENPSVSAQEIKELAMSRRFRLDYLRQLIGDLSRAYLLSYYGNKALHCRKMKNKQPGRITSAVIFIDSIILYLQWTSGDCCKTGTRMSGLADYLNDIDAGLLTREEVVENVRLMKDSLPASWAKVSGAYADLRAKCLT